MKALIRVYSVILLAYTGWRTFDFIGLQMPNTDTNWWLSLAFLFAVEIGLIVWHETSLNHVTTDKQENIAKFMTWTDFVASFAAGTADMIMRQTMVEGYQIPRALADVLIYGMPAVVAANVAAAIMFEDNDADTKIKTEKRKVSFAIHKAALADLLKAKDEIVRSKKTPIYQSLRDDVTGAVDRRYQQALTSGSAQSTTMASETRQELPPPSNEQTNFTQPQ